jgi:Flp pilus assembly protein TadG
VRLHSRLSGHFLAKLRCELGQSAVEFALVVPILLALICGIVEVSRLYYVRLSIRDVTLEATRFAVTGRTLINPATGQPFTRAASVARLIRIRTDSLKVALDSISINPADGGKPSEVVTIRVFYKYAFSLAPLRNIVSTSPMSFSVASSMKNEPVF